MKEKTYTVKIEVEFEIHTSNLDNTINDLTDLLEEVPVISVGGLVSVKSIEEKDKTCQNQTV